METYKQQQGSFSAKILTQNVLKRQILTVTLAKFDTILSLFILYFTSYLIPKGKLFYF